MEIKDKIELRKQILKELYISWEKGEDFINKLDEKFDKINELDLDLQILYLSDKGYLTIYGRCTGPRYLNCAGIRISEHGIDLIENKEEFNHLFKIEVNNVSDINNSVISIGNNNKIENINNEIDKILEIIEKNNLDRKDDIKALLNEFKSTNDKNKLVDVFSILGSGASINSMIIALSSLINP
ncbi:hypothetical protein HUU51_02470 [Candidatus Gracilibacteria bacterium]|nr:hypothetical protein [Candidatus Gracilibacteria bacterium]